MKDEKIAFACNRRNHSLQKDGKWFIPTAFLRGNPVLSAGGSSFCQYRNAENFKHESNEVLDWFIITHGTDTMAYTAAALSYLIQNPGKPIVLTGSQKPISDDITDARKNLADSLRFACEGQAAGVYIVFDGKPI